MKKIILMMLVSFVVLQASAQCGTYQSDSVYFESGDRSTTFADDHIIEINCTNTYIIKITNENDGTTISPVFKKALELTEDQKEIFYQIGLYQNNQGKWLKIGVAYNGKVVIVSVETGDIFIFHKEI